MKCSLPFFSIFFVVFHCWGAGAEFTNPYSTLGVSRTASQAEIRTAYKQLVREWHPDRGKHAADGQRFMEIQRAYEILSDSDRRKRYDEKGIISDDEFSSSSSQDYYYSTYGDEDPLRDLFHRHGAHFNFQSNDMLFFHKLSITARQYDKLVVPQSKKTPHLVLFYTDWCFLCLQSAPYYRKLIEYLEPLGVNFYTIHAVREAQLTKRLNIYNLPSLALVLDGNVILYKEPISSIQNVFDFIRNKLPYRLIEKVGDEYIDQFLDLSWDNNKVRGLIFDSIENTRLRYLLVAYHFRYRVVFGHARSEKLRERYKIPMEMDAVLLFNENSTHPMATIAMKDIPSATLRNIVSSNQYLTLPRLSSQDMLEEICPCEWFENKRKLCVVLITASNEHHNHNSNNHIFRLLAEKWKQRSTAVKFAYIYIDKQQDFIRALIEGSNMTLSPLYRSTILWRRDLSHIKFLWTNHLWNFNENMNQTIDDLESTIENVLNRNVVLSFEAIVDKLFDEHRQSLLYRIFSTLCSIVRNMYDGFTREQILSVLSVVGTVLFILIVGYLMAYLVRIEEEKIQKEKAEKKTIKNNSSTTNNGHGGTGRTMNSTTTCNANTDLNSTSSTTVNNNNYQPELRIHEMRAEKYNALVRLLKPGCRTIVLLLDTETKQTLIPPFHKALWPYRKNKSLMFSFLNVERGLNWYKQLLELSIPNCWELKINPKNCVGTVLSLNGYRKYFCMFHAKYNEERTSHHHHHHNHHHHHHSSSNSSNNNNNNHHHQKVKKSSHLKRHIDCESGSFIGFNDSDSMSSSDDEVVVLHRENLLDGLSSWLDRLFEGTTKRYHINYWPDFPYK